MADMVAEGTPEEDVSTERWVDARYRGQSFELRVEASDWRAAFHEAHRVRYGYARPDAPVEAVTLRVVARAPGPTLEHRPLATAEGPPPTQPGDAVHEGAHVPTVRVWRRDLRAGHRLQGPVQVLEYSGTTWVPPEWTLEVDTWGSLHLSRTT